MPDKNTKGTSNVWIKVSFKASYWKIAWVLNFAEKVLRIETKYWSGGTGTPQW